MADHPVSGCDMRHVRANFKNDSPSFMSEKMRKKLIRALDPIDLTNLRPADARSVNIDEDLSAFERRNFDLVDDERLALFDQNGGGCFQTVLTTDYTDYTNRVRTDRLQTFRPFLPQRKRSGDGRRQITPISRIGSD
jgi:hypothetical protein